MKYSGDPKSLARLKAQLRSEAKAARQCVPDRVAAAKALMRCFEESPWAYVPEGSVVTGYWPIGSEIDCRPLLRRLRRMGAVIGLPAVEVLNAPLTFREWDGTAPDGLDQVKMAAPGVEARKVIPDIVLVPLLLVDRIGHRLGYGGGYYDRTLNALRLADGVTAVGLAFDTQITDKLPVGVYDMMLDGLVTNKGWREFKPGGAAPAPGPRRR